MPFCLFHLTIPTMGMNAAAVGMVLLSVCFPVVLDTVIGIATNWVLQIHNYYVVIPQIQGRFNPYPVNKPVDYRTLST